MEYKKMETARWSDLSPSEAYFQAALQFAQYQLIQKEIPSQEECEESPALDSRILRMIDTQLRKRTRNPLNKRMAMKLLRTAAVALLILNLLLTTAFALNGDFRERVNRLFVRTYPTHSDIDMEGDPELIASTGTQAMLTDYALTWLPGDNCEIVERTGTLLTKSVTYASDDDVYIILDISGQSIAGTINTEGMESSLTHLNGEDLQVFHHENEYVIIWQEGECHFVLNAKNLTESEAILAALSVSPAAN